MASRGAHVTVSDINPDMLKVGEQRAERRGLKGLTWKVENAEKLSFADSTFDAYTIVFGIRNVTDIPAALREAHRVLKRGGPFLLHGVFLERLAGLLQTLRGLGVEHDPAHRQDRRQ